MTSWHQSSKLIMFIDHIMFINQIKCMFMQLCMTYLTTSQHLCINACFCSMHVHVILKDVNPNHPSNN